jgi:hypothetical protein
MVRLGLWPSVLLLLVQVLVTNICIRVYALHVMRPGTAFRGARIGQETMNSHLVCPYTYARSCGPKFLLQASTIHSSVDVPDMSYAPVIVSKMDLYAVCKYFRPLFDRFRFLRALLEGTTLY